MCVRVCQFLLVVYACIPFVAMNYLAGWMNTTVKNVMVRLQFALIPIVFFNAIHPKDINHLDLICGFRGDGRSCCSRSWISAVYQIYTRNQNH